MNKKAEIKKLDRTFSLLPLIVYDWDDDVCCLAVVWLWFNWYFDFEK